VLLLVTTIAGPAAAATTRLPSEFRPVAAEGSARAAWVNPAGIGDTPWQSLLVEVSAVEQADGEFDINKLAALSVATSTGHTAYAFRKELDDVDGVPDWAVIVANRVQHRNGTVFGSALEWRGGETQGLDATFALARQLAGALRGSIVLEDALATDVDGADGSRRWRGGVALRPPGGTMFLGWDYDVLESDDEGRHWFSLGMDRGHKWEFLVTVNDQGDWSGRAGIRLGPVRWGGGYRATDGSPAIGVASIDLVGDPVVR
jgi:hypothetical protein